MTAELDTSDGPDALSARDRLAALLPWAIYERVRTLSYVDGKQPQWLGVVGQFDGGVTFWTDQDVVAWVDDPMLIAGLTAGEWDRFEAAWILLSDHPTRRRVQVTLVGEVDSAQTRVVVGAVSTKGCGRRLRRNVSLTLGEGWVHCRSSDGEAETWRRSP